MRRLKSILIIMFLVSGCKTIELSQEYEISSFLNNECRVQSVLSLNSYSHPFDYIIEGLISKIVNCDDVQAELTRQYKKLGPIKIELENRLK